MSVSGPRRQAREAALQVIFAADVGREVESDSVEEAYEDVLDGFSLPPRARIRTLEIVRGVAANVKAIDERISRSSANWKVSRLATVDRNILRIATYELLYETETPIEVIIDEAVEIAHRFGGDASPGFVNGVLDVIARDRGPRA